jgi:hypothetical protein
MLTESAKPVWLWHSSVWRAKAQSTETDHWMTVLTSEIGAAKKVFSERRCQCAGASAESLRDPTVPLQFDCQLPARMSYLPTCPGAEAG